MSKKPSLVNRDLCPLLQNAQTERRRWVVETNRQKASFLIKDNGQVAWFARMALAFNRIVKKPGMTAVDCAFSLPVYVQSDTAIRWFGECGQVLVGVCLLRHCIVTTRATRLSLAPVLAFPLQ